MGDPSTTKLFLTFSMYLSCHILCFPPPLLLVFLSLHNIHILVRRGVGGVLSSILLMHGRGEAEEGIGNNNAGPISAMCSEGGFFYDDGLSFDCIGTGDEGMDVSLNFFFLLRRKFCLASPEGASTPHDALDGCGIHFSITTPIFVRNGTWFFFARSTFPPSPPFLATEGARPRVRPDFSHGVLHDYVFPMYQAVVSFFASRLLAQADVDPAPHPSF